MASKRSAHRLFRRVVPLFLVLMLLVGLLPNFAQAATPKEIPDHEAALVLTGRGYFELNSSSSTLFHLEHAVPGDFWTGKIKVKNEVPARMELCVLSIVNNLADSALFDALELEITHEGEILYSGSYNPGDDGPVTKHIKIAPLGSEVLDVTVRIPETLGNEFQGKEMDSTWTFEARNYGQPLYLVQYRYNGDIPPNAPPLPSSTAHPRGEKVTVAEEPAVEGYDFYWHSNAVDISDGTFTMPDKPVTIIGTWTKKADPTPDDPTPETHSVTYKYEGDIPENAPEIPADAQYEPGTTVTVAEAPVVDGYEFTWTTEDVEVTDGSFTMPDQDVVFIGTWTKKDSPVIPDDPDPDPSTDPDSPQTGVDLITETVRDGMILWIIILVAAGAAIIYLRLYAAKKRLKEQEGRTHNHEEEN